MYNHKQDYRFVEVMALLAEQCGQETNEFKERIYSEGLADIPIEAIQKAAWELVKTRSFASFPKIAEIRDIVDGRVEDHGQVQAALVWDTIKRHGGARSVCFDDPVTQAVIHQAFGGWTKMCSELMEDQIQWFIKDFAKHYIAFRRSGVKHFGALLGYADPVNSTLPALIGNPEKAMAVLTEGPKETPLIAGLNVSALADKMGI